MQRHDVASTLRRRYIYVMCLPGKCSTVLSTSLGKTFFSWRFILNENNLVWLTISCQIPFVFYVSVFYSQIFTQRLKLRPKVGLTYAISIVKWFFWNFCLRKYFLLFFAEFELLTFYNNIVKISEKIEQVELGENLAPSYLPYRFLHDLASFLLWEKVKIFDFFKPITRIKLFVICSYDKWFCIKSWQKFANLLLLCKASSKNDFLKDIESTVIILLEYLHMPSILSIWATSYKTVSLRKHAYSDI